MGLDGRHVLSMDNFEFFKARIWGFGAILGRLGVEIASMRLELWPISNQHKYYNTQKHNNCTQNLRHIHFLTFLLISDHFGLNGAFILSFELHFVLLQLQK